jgi:hypothetical protein
LLGQLSDVLLVLICEFSDILISKSSDIVSFNDSLEDGEAVFLIGEVVKSVDVDTCDLDFISWSG